LSSSLPSSSFAHPNSLTVPTATTKALDDSTQDGGSIPCPACTFLNHSSLRTCELCDTELPRPSKSKGRTRATIMKSAPVSRPSSPDNDDDEGEWRTENMYMKLSFRKGGVQAMYATLKRCLKSKAWEVRRHCVSFLNSGLGAHCRLFDRIPARLRCQERGPETTPKSMDGKEAPSTVVRTTLIGVLGYVSSFILPLPFDLPTNHNLINRQPRSSKPSNTPHKAGPPRCMTLYKTSKLYE
jgi:hypothetical protein